MPRREARYSQAFAALVKGKRGNRSRLAFACLVGISASYLEKIEAGSVPSAERIRTIATRLGEDPADWLAAAGYQAEGVSEPGQPYQPAVMPGEQDMEARLQRIEQEIAEIRGMLAAEPRPADNIPPRSRAA